MRAELAFDLEPFRASPDLPIAQRTATPKTETHGMRIAPGHAPRDA